MGRLIPEQYVKDLSDLICVYFQKEAIGFRKIE